MTLIFVLRIAHPLKNQALLFRFVVLILDLSLPHFYLYKNPIFCSAVSLNRLETCLVFILKEEQRCKKKDKASENPQKEVFWPAFVCRQHQKTGRNTQPIFYTTIFDHSQDWSVHWTVIISKVEFQSFTLTSNERHCQICKCIVSTKYIDGCRSVDCINCSLVTPVNRQSQSDGYYWRLFWCCDDMVKMEETSHNRV